MTAEPDALGAVTAALPEAEDRPGQQQMADLVAHAIRTRLSRF